MAVLDLNNIKENIQTVLQAQNTTTASILDLSNGLTERIKKVFKKHPRHLVGQASEMPCVTVFIDGKTIENTTISPNQRTQAKRKAEVNVHVAAMLWDNNFGTNDDDEAEDDIESVIENVEEILRNDPTVSGTVDFIIPQDVVFFNLYEDNAHMVTGVLSLKVVKLY